MMKLELGQASSQSLFQDRCLLVWRIAVCTLLLASVTLSDVVAQSKHRSATRHPSHSKAMHIDVRKLRAAGRSLGVVVTITDDNKVLGRRHLIGDPSLEDSKWSGDHKALAYEERWDHGKRLIRLVVWTQARGFREYTSPKRLFRNSSGITDIVWSPDGHRLLFRTYGYDGKSDSTPGETLWSMNITKGRMHKIGSGIHWARWITSRKFEYWKVDVPYNTTHLDPIVRARVLKAASKYSIKATAPD